MVTNLFHLNKFTHFPALRPMEFIKSNPHGYSRAPKWRGVKTMTRQTIVDEMSATSEDKSFGEAGEITNNANNRSKRYSIAVVILSDFPEVDEISRSSVVRRSNSVAVECGRDFDKIRDYYGLSHESEFCSCTICQFQWLGKRKLVSS